METTIKKRKIKVPSENARPPDVPISTSTRLHLFVKSNISLKFSRMPSESTSLVFDGLAGSKLYADSESEKFEPGQSSSGKSIIFLAPAFASIWAIHFAPSP